jgi:small-conductance mechanosensitive channel
MSQADAIALAKDLLRFDTINPPGRERDRAQWAARAGLAAFVLLAFVLLLPGAAAAEEEQGVPLVVGHRTIHVFRAPVGMFSAEEREQAARRRIEAALEQPGDGWTSVKPTAQGMEIAIDGKPLFLVVPGDARAAAGESPEDLANAASRVLQKVWSEARERRDPRANLEALLKVALATALLVVVSAAAIRLAAFLRRRIVKGLAAHLGSRKGEPPPTRVAAVLPGLAGRLIFFATWLLGLFVIFVYLTYSLSQFVLTRPAGDSLAHSIRSLAVQALGSVTDSLPGMFIAVVIFLLAWVATRVSAELFAGVQARPEESPFVNTHTAPATRRIVNASLWLFAVAMAYPYLPGSHTEAFKGLSVIVGLMVSIGASGVVGQIASGVMIVYTYALRVGEYVRIQEHEGTVTEIGLFVTRLRTGMGEEISLPNTLVLANVTRNFSRAGSGVGYVLDVTLTIGYDTPWRQVYGLMLVAARRIPQVRAEPPPYVVQTALSDFYVAYKLVAHVDASTPASRARVASHLHEAIQDEFNRHGVQIMSPHYEADPVAPKVVPESRWHAAPAGVRAPEDS